MLQSIKFTLKDGSVREFSLAAHGADFEILASEFSDGNKDIAERLETKSDSGSPEVPVAPEVLEDAPPTDPAPESAPEPEIPPAPAAEEPPAPPVA